MDCQKIYISDSTSILIFKSEDYSIVQDHLKSFKGKLKAWSQHYFKFINKDKRLFTDKKNPLLNRFQEQIDFQRNYFLGEFLNVGGEGIIFEGYFKKGLGEYLEIALKVVFGGTEEEIDKELKIMKLFEKCINVIQFYDKIKLSDDIFVLTLEKCEYSLRDELDLIQKSQKHHFHIEKLIKIILDLLDGVIQLRLYKILHLDIKPQNILYSKKGYYVYADFGISDIKKDAHHLVKVKGFSKTYVSPEQKSFSHQINFKADVYSLGVTFDEIIQIFLKQDQVSFKQLQIIQDLKETIQQKMKQNQVDQRLNCLDLHSIIFEILFNLDCTNQIEYLQKIDSIYELQPFDNNKDIPYFSKLNLYYQQQALKISQKILPKINKSFVSQYISKYKFNISKCYQILSKYNDALEFAQESLEMFKQIFQGNHSSIASSLSLIAQCYQYKSDYENALKLAQESHEMSKQIFQGNHSSITSSLYLIAQCYKHKSDYENALKFAQESFQFD